MRWTLITLLLLGACRPPVESRPEVDATSARPQALIAGYIEDYFLTFPSRATAAGRHDHDTVLEDLGPERRAAWIARNRRLVAEIDGRLGSADLSWDDRVDLALVRRSALRQIDDFETLNRPQHDPLFWTGVAANATIFLLVRDDLPLANRLASATLRAEHLPRLLTQAEEAMESTPPEGWSAELAQLAARQARASAVFYRDGFAGAADALPEPATRRHAMAMAGAAAAAALDGWAEWLEARAAEATGSPRLEERYAARFRIVTGVDRPLDEVLGGAEAALEAKRLEAAAFGRSVWSRWMTGPAPDRPAELLRALFARVAEDRASDVDAFVADYRQLIDEMVSFVRDQGVITLPEPLTVHTDRSPAFFVGQSVGGVYPAGPYAPEADTLFFLPTPASGASAESQDAFFRDFNHHFNVMIVPHELVPGHYLQLRAAAWNPRKVRALMSDGVAVEGWGTFCERLMLDLGWGDELARLAHLKKQLENIARTIVDIRVHTLGMTRDEVLAFVRDEALQDEQFAANMWVRSITTAPQLTFYHLGDRAVTSLYEDVRAAQGASFSLRTFMDTMMAIGPVPVADARPVLLGSVVAP